MTGTDSATIPNEASQARRLFLANMAALWRADSLLAQQTR